MLREAQREFSARSSHRVSPLRLKNAKSRCLTFVNSQLGHDVCVVHLQKHSFLFAKVPSKQVVSRSSAEFLSLSTQP